MNEKRKQLYREIEKNIGNTPLTTYDGLVPNNNTIHIKWESENPGGSHYTRVYLELYRHFEELGKISPGDKVLETTSGTAGRDFAWLGQQLDFKPNVGVPADTERHLIEKMKEYGATLHFTPAEDYVNGFPRFITRFLAQNKDFSFLNHSMGPKRGPAYTNNEVTLSALENIAHEVLDEVHVDIYLPIVGNGSTVLGPGRVFYGHGTQIVTVEHVQSAVTYDQIFPGKYSDTYGIEIGTLPKHKLRGSSYPGIDFPHIRNVVNSGIVSDAMLVSDKETDGHYRNLNGTASSEKSLAEYLPHWDTLSVPGLGPTGNAGIAAALTLAEKIRDKNMLIIGYSTR